jgi:hypothetical protein
MKKGTKRLLSGLALAAGAFGAVGAYLAKKKTMGTRDNQLYRNHDADVWARPGMMVTFRAELMPGRDRQERTFRVKEILPSGRVTLDGASGEHAEKEFVQSR